MIVLALLCSTLAFLLFGATDRHHRRHLGAWYSSRRATRLTAAGWLLLAATMASAMAIYGAVIGPIAGTGAMVVGAAASFAVLNALRQ